MVIEFSEVDDSRVRWNSDGEWKSADIDELIAAYERKRGKWITEYDSWGGLFKTVRAHKCSICGHYLDFDGVNAGRGDANYCPNCGAKMERSEE